MNIEKLLKPPPPPERIYNWLNTQMSIARHWGSCKYQGHVYYVSPNEKGAPLVRADVLAKEAKEAALKKRTEKALAKSAQTDLLGDS